MGLLLRVVDVTPAAFCCFLSLLFATHHLPFMPVATAAADYSNETDRLALLRFKEEIFGNPLSSWNGSRHFCKWEGVTCGRHHPQRVIALNLNSHNLVARAISPHISNLTFLRLIDLSNNTFRGVIPGEIGRLFRLRSLLLFNNTLSGELPMNLTSCSEIRNLKLGRNKLSGNIPAELGSLSKLTFLGVAFNNFKGRIPPSLGNLSSLTDLYLLANRLEGSIPADLGQLAVLEKLGIFDNQLSGIVPSSIYNLSYLQSIDVGFNRFQGHLPPHLFLSLPNLSRFSVAENQFMGPIPVSLPNATSLQMVQLSGNYFKGSVPISLGLLQNLTILRLAANELGNGSIHDLNFLDSLTNCSNLEHLQIGGNNLGGVLPDSLANFSTHLRNLNMFRNRIFGSIPSGIGNLVNLQELVMDQNMFTGAIPLNIGKLQQMVRLHMYDNELSSNIPVSFCNMTELNILYLYNNNLEGNIPQCLEYCRQLQVLQLDNNNFKGTLPQQLFSFPTMYHLSVGNNSLSGNLQMKVGSLTSFQTLDVSDNNFSGEIPSSLGDCISLEYLILGGNHFQGILPSTLNSLRGLRYLDLSHNELSGKIPEYLEKIQLEYLNLSFNDFEGELPKEGIFKNASAVSVIGNSKLCGGIHKLYLHPCIHEQSKKTSHLTKAKIMITITVLGGFALSSLLASFLYIRSRSSRKKSSSFPSSLEDAFMNVSYKELLKATDGFSSSYLFGTGSYGSVYKGTLHQNIIGATIVAVKVLHLLQQGALKSFMAECEALRSIRHRNLIKILTCCSSIDFKGNDFKALVFEYMPNGSLQNWLSKDNEGERTLKLIQRLNILIDVASALNYLHYHCQAPIVHCDLKPNNILLDADMVAHVSDFGLARFVSTIAESTTIEMKGSIGYIAPEYGMRGKASREGDVYSYGILILEVITGKRPTDNMFESNLTLHHHVRLALSVDKVIEIADPYLLLEEADQNLESFDDFKQKMRECLGSIAQIGVACSVEIPRERMKMNEVIDQMHVIRDLYLGVHVQGNAQALDQGSSYLSNY